MGAKLSSGPAVRSWLLEEIKAGRGSDLAGIKRGNDVAVGTGSVAESVAGCSTTKTEGSEDVPPPAGS